MRETVVICSYAEENADIAQIIHSSFQVFLQKELRGLRAAEGDDAHNEGRLSREV